MKVLVTGAAGFIGSHTSERLKSMGHEVIAIDNFSGYYDVTFKKLNANSLQNIGVEVNMVDLREDDLSKVIPTDTDFIFHFAAQPGISASSTFQEYFTNNILYSTNIGFVGNL